MRRLTHCKTPALLSAVLVAASVLTVSANTITHAAPQAATTVQPTRVLDTRTGVGAPVGRLNPGTVLTLALPAAKAAGATTVALNITATEAVGDGWVKAWPCSEPMPDTSSLNFTVGKTAANAAIVKLSPTGVCFASNMAVHLIADNTGWFTSAQDVVGITPSRFLDTRVANQPLKAGEERRLTIAGQRGVAGNAKLVAVNVTVDSPAQAGWVVAYPCGAQPNASTVNFSAGDVVANLSIVGLSGTDICLRSNVTVHVVVDAFGYSDASGQLRAQNPTRLLDTRDFSNWTSGKAVSGTDLELQMAARAGVPSDADGVIVNITVVNPTAEGYVTAWPCDQPLPVASTLNTWAGALRSNLAIIKLSRVDGKMCLTFRSGSGMSSDFVVDVVGWLTGGPARTIQDGTGPTTSTVLFGEDFTNPSGQGRFDYQLHTSMMGPQATKISASFVGEHDRDCHGPDTSRTIAGGQSAATFIDVSNSDLIWYCAPGNDTAKGHMMTALDTADIATLSFSPKQTFTNVGKVCWDQNMNDLGEGKWVNIFVVPASDVSSYGGNLNYAAATGLAFGGITQMLPATAYDFTWLRGTTFVNGAEMMWASNSHGIAATSPPRFQICLQNSGRTLVVHRPDGSTDTINTGKTFPTGEVKVIFQDASYNPVKHNGSESHLTWHWDNFIIAT
jgi:hypothetical protein